MKARVGSEGTLKAGVPRSPDEIASELERLWAEQGRRARDICELLDRLARSPADWPELRLVANLPLVDVAH